MMATNSSVTHYAYVAESDQREVAADSDAYVIGKRIDDDKEGNPSNGNSIGPMQREPTNVLVRIEGKESKKKRSSSISTRGYRSGPIEPTSREKTQTGRMEQGDPPCSRVSQSSYEKIEVYTSVVPSGKEKWELFYRTFGSKVSP